MQINSPGKEDIYIKCKVNKIGFEQSLADWMYENNFYELHCLLSV